MFELKEDESKKSIKKRLVERVKTGVEILEECEEDILKTLQIRGRTLKEWGKELKVPIPVDTEDRDAIAEALNGVGESIQRAQYILGLYEAYAKVSHNLHEEVYSERFVEELEKNPRVRVAAEKVRQKAMLDKEVDGSLSLSQSAEVVVGFFKRQVRALEETRKCLESRVWLLGQQTKILNT